MAAERRQVLINLTDVLPYGVGQIVRGVIQFSSDVGERKAQLTEKGNAIEATEILARVDPMPRPLAARTT